MPRYTCQFCGATSRTTLQISPIDPTLKLCSSCVRYQRIQVANKTFTPVVTQENKSENEKTNTQADGRKITNSDNLSMDSPQMKKVNQEKGVQKTYSKTNKNKKSFNSINSVPMMKKKKKQHDHVAEHKNQNLNLQNTNRKRKLYSDGGIFVKKKKIKLSSIFEPQKTKKEGQLRKSKYHGVFWNRTNGTWTAKYSCGGKTTHVTSGKNESKVAKELRKAVREAKRNGAKPKVPYGKLKKDAKPKTNSVYLSANDIEVVKAEKHSSESSPEPPIIVKKKSMIPLLPPKMNISSTKSPLSSQQNTSVLKKVKREELSSSEVKAKRKFIYKGVSWNKKRQCWVGQIQHKGNRYFCKTNKNASIVAECVRKKAIELRKEGIDIPKGYGIRKLNKNAENSEPKLKQIRKAQGKPKKEYYRSSSDSEVESSEQLTSSYDWKELKKQGRKYNAPLKANELFSITLNWNEMLAGKTLEDGEASSSGGSSSDNAGYF